MNLEQAIEAAKDNKFHVLELTVDGEDYFFLDADPINNSKGEFQGKTTLACHFTFMGPDEASSEEKKRHKESRLQDLKDDCAHYYKGGRDSEEYKRIIWPQY